MELTVAQFVGLLIQFGPKAFDLADRLIARMSNPSPLTSEDIAYYRRIASNTPKSKMIEALNNAGIPLDSEKGKAFLAMAGE